MAGKQLTIKHLVLYLMLAFGSLIVSENVCAGPVAILLSDEEKTYRAPIATFTEEIDKSVEIFNLHGEIDNAPALMDEILSRNPALIFALGAKAAYIAKTWTTERQEIPVLFAMVLNWQRYNLLEGQKNITGITYEVAPGTQFLNMTIFSPKTNKIGVIYSKEHSGLIITKAKEAVQLLGLELITKNINHPKEFRRAYKELSNKIDSYWILSDPVVYTFDNLSWLRKKCLKDRIVCIGQSKNVAKLGTLLAIDPDIPNIGSQAASIGKDILLRHHSPSEIGVKPPLGTKLFLNLKTARKIGMTISQPAMDMASEIIDE